jgi:hypothetical protein
MIYSIKLVVAADFRALIKKITIIRLCRVVVKDLIDFNKVMELFVIGWI